MGVKVQHCLCNGDGSTTGCGISPITGVAPPKEKGIKTVVTYLDY